jgi:hypothetical protein
MPGEAFEAQVRYMVRKDIAADRSESFDAWRRKRGNAKST